ncbi:SpoIIE family protein phosphatase [Actinomycetospora endophytica]|uniref:SpoIIE family protein phosphatase n=1 Tax=Actinomycetospora endophytica TaxID=2291215 RepID=A0ABS8PC37_9PSEU|nr:SpoIIE family protein phosphatase [Actinomycetospora endophytica]MCD2195854.1 SpoIIE family protein phosphatase [Actinomycetospora endophytica]
MSGALGRHVRLPPESRSAGVARRLLRGVLAEVGSDEDTAETATLLASELCENAVLHAGTTFDFAVAAGDDGITVSVTDQGSSPLEVHLAEPRSRTGRAATHGRGMALVESLATAWGTRHDTEGHCVWFTLGPAGVVAPTEPAPGRTEAVPADARPGEPAQIARTLLHLPPAVSSASGPGDQAAELLRRLCELTGATAAEVTLDYGDGDGPVQLARAGADPQPPGDPMRLPLALPAPLTGTLSIEPGAGADRSGLHDLAELTAMRIASGTEIDWLRGVDQRRRSWTTFLAEAGELLAQSTDLRLTSALVPQIAIPRLGPWCALHLAEEHSAVHLELAALAHADEAAVTRLRAAVLDRSGPASVPDQLAEAMFRRRPVTVGDPASDVSGLAVPLVARGDLVGVLTVGRPPQRPHTAEETAVISDLARRAALAIDNARITGRHAETSFALQRALLPRALPRAPEVEFTAEYLPASAGSEVGGDFYDVLELPERRWLVTVGDVCGKGARAAARTSLVRDVLRVLIREGHPLSEAVAELNTVMLEAEDPYLFCTLACALVSGPVSGEGDGLAVELLLAGHDQPLHQRPDGRVEPVGIHGTAIGLVREVSVVGTRLRLAAGEALVFYTDGVSEQPRDGRPGAEPFGEDRLVSAVGGAGSGSADDVIAEVRAAVTAYGAGSQRDDIALFVVRAVPGTAAPAPAPAADRGVVPRPPDVLPAPRERRSPA